MGCCLLKRTTEDAVSGVKRQWQGDATYQVLDRLTAKQFGRLGTKSALSTVSNGGVFVDRDGLGS